MLVKKFSSVQILVNSAKSSKIAMSRQSELSMEYLVMKRSINVNAGVVTMHDMQVFSSGCDFSSHIALSTSNVSVSVFGICGQRSV